MAGHSLMSSGGLGFGEVAGMVALEIALLIIFHGPVGAEILELFYGSSGHVHAFNHTAQAGTATLGGAEAAAHFHPELENITIGAAQDLPEFAL